MTLQQLRYIVAIAEAGTLSGGCQGPLHLPAKPYENRTGTGK